MVDGLPQDIAWHKDEHRGWKIYFEYPPIPDRRFDFQASDPNGDGEPVAYGANVEECKADIDRILSERPQCGTLFQPESGCEECFFCGRMLHAECTAYWGDEA